MAKSYKIEDPTGLERGTIEAMCDRVQAHLMAPVEAAATPIPLSSEVEKQIAKRTAPGALHKHMNMKSAIMNYVVDLADTSTRIRRYQFIERYRDLGPVENKDMFIALLEHTHALKSHEIYVIAERGTQMLRFGHTLTTNLGISGVDNANRFLRVVKKKFEYRLRERHRMVHYHERPSLMSRMLALDGESWTDPEVAGVILSFQSFLRETLGKLREAGRLKAPLPDGDRGREWQRCDDEAASLWSILSKFVLENIGASDSGDLSVAKGV